MKKLSEIEKRMVADIYRHAAERYKVFHAMQSLEHLRPAERKEYLNWMASMYEKLGFEDRFIPVVETNESIRYIGQKFEVIERAPEELCMKLMTPLWGIMLECGAVYVADAREISRFHREETCTYMINRYRGCINSGYVGELLRLCHDEMIA